MGGFSDSTDLLPEHTLEDILSRLPYSSVGASRSASKRWQSVSTSSTFLSLYSERQEQSSSWLYVNGFRYRITDHTSPVDSSTPIPTIAESFGHSWGAGGVAYTFSSSSSLQYKDSLLDSQWEQTPPLPHPRTLPIVAAVKSLPHGAHKLVVVGGLPSESSKESLSTVCIFDSGTRTWLPGDDVPHEFQGIATSRSVTAVVCDRKLHLFHIYSGMATSLDVATGKWSAVKTLRPPGMQYCYLAARHGKLLLVGVSHENDRFCFRGWKVREMECEGDSWPVVCHFGSESSSRSAGNWLAKKPAEDAFLDPLAAISNLLRRIPFCKGILGFFDAVREFATAIS